MVDALIVTGWVAYCFVGMIVTVFREACDKVLPLRRSFRYWAVKALRVLLWPFVVVELVQIIVQEAQKRSQEANRRFEEMQQRHDAIRREFDREWDRTGRGR